MLVNPLLMGLTDEESNFDTTTVYSEARRKASASSSRSKFTNFIDSVRISQVRASPSAKLLMGVISPSATRAGPEQWFSLQLAWQCQLQVSDEAQCCPVTFSEILQLLFLGMKCIFVISYQGAQSFVSDLCFCVPSARCEKDDLVYTVRIHQVNAEICFYLRFGNFCFLLLIPTG